MKYNLDWVKHLFEVKTNLNYIFFWGHYPGKDGQVGKSCLSQWWEINFEINNVLYNSTEHWMMAEKARLFKDNEMLTKILKAKTPKEAKILGREVNNFDDRVWKIHRYEIVKIGNKNKFEQNPSLKEYLIATKNSILVEASPYDNIWGIGMKEEDRGIENPNNWQGLNLLGFALMEVRDEFTSEGLTDLIKPRKTK